MLASAASTTNVSILIFTPTKAARTTRSRTIAIEDKTVRPDFMAQMPVDTPVHGNIHHNIEDCTQRRDPAEIEKHRGQDGQYDGVDQGVLLDTAGQIPSRCAPASSRSTSPALRVHALEAAGGDRRETVAMIASITVNHRSEVTQRRSRGLRQGIISSPWMISDSVRLPATATGDQEVANHADSDRSRPSPSTGRTLRSTGCHEIVAADGNVSSPTPSAGTSQSTCSRSNNCRL